MRVLVLHSDVPPDAPADELDTLLGADAIVSALATRGYIASRAAFVPDPQSLHSLLRAARCDIVFNLVESVFGQGELAGLAPTMLAKLRVAYTGCAAAPLSLTCDKPRTKRVFRATGLPTADWVEPPEWNNLVEGVRYVVKSAVEDASLGLDDASVVTGSAAVHARAAYCSRRFGGNWFAETYLQGREFNVSLLEENGAPRVLPIPEIRFEAWPSDRPQLVGYAAKWDDRSEDAIKTVRVFGVEAVEPGLACALTKLAKKTWQVLGLSGFARVDFRLDADGAPMILEVNPNPCIEPTAGFAVAAAEAGLSYPEIVERILLAADRN